MISQWGRLCKYGDTSPHIGNQYFILKISVNLTKMSTKFTWGGVGVGSQGGVGGWV